MFFQRKGRLRKEFDEKLLTQLNNARNFWYNQKSLVEKCLDPSEDIISEAKLAELKYFFLIREAKSRKISIRK
ncbi:YaaL family protein [Bacillus sp. DNRA2]|uniref:YaaL family protein n=1 Tax=Bacillus sp. DNRA2 TaxID=2723053 RepID=UPI00145EFB33|nr:YaaL family protein [Bacillus sp. DNRA2]NMD72766.1 YaaL family protein [Bacillus sp. DNRA2]